MEMNDVGRDNEFEHGTDLIEGRNPVIEALKNGREINKIFVAKGDREGSIRHIVSMARAKGIVVQEVEPARLNSISVTHSHQGIIAFASPVEYVEVEDILASASSKKETPFIVMLDGLTDPHNLGAILRTADAAGVHGVIIPKRRSAGLTATVAKASAGAIEYVPVARVPNIVQAMEKLKKAGLWVAGTDAGADKTLFDTDLKGPIAVVIGSEGEGLGKLVKEKCDFLVSIPMKGRISSLNAATAGAVIMYEIVRQRNM